jgi:hypothetical protein
MLFRPADGPRQQVSQTLSSAIQIVGDRFGHGIDDTHIKIRGAPVLDEAALDAHQKMIADKLQVRAGSKVRLRS